VVGGRYICVSKKRFFVGGRDDFAGELYRLIICRFDDWQSALAFGDFLPVSRSETTMAVGLSPRTAARYTIPRRRATAERSNRTVAFNRRSATRDHATPLRGLKSTAYHHGLATRGSPAGRSAPADYQSATQQPAKLPVYATLNTCSPEERASERRAVFIGFPWPAPHSCVAGSGIKGEGQAQQSLFSLRCGMFTED